ncbi:ABC transporter ATP-binding protein [Acidobacteria bacterium AH-259-D05]|nr:ABC transporter ATP-binding protein [Acidobacteria bacterium AH-259-D05]
MAEERLPLSDSVTDSQDETVVEITNVSFRYGQHQALKDVSFSVQRSQIFGLLGPNGGGKTTLFRILCTLLVPEGGKAKVGGVDVKEDPHKVRRMIGVVFQSNSLDLQLTSEENLLCQGRLYGLRGSGLKERAENLMIRFGLENRCRDLVATLSGGLRRRLELAKGLLHRPQILILDEPTSGLDPGARRDFWKYLRNLRDEDGMTLLFTTHLMEETERCDHLVILSEGQVVANGSPVALKEKIGGDVIVVQTPDPEHFCDLIRKRFSCEPVVVDGTVRLELPQGHKVAAELMESFPEQIEAVTVGKPTLEDVFIHNTGRRFDGDEAENRKNPESRIQNPQ